jgi:diaminopropionate ammonia-lyase
MLQEVDEQVLTLTDKKPVTVAIASVGVGSWAHSVVSHYKSNTTPSTSVITVEASAAPCLNTSLKANRIVPIGTGETIMNGMNCGTVSTIAWPYLRDGVDASVVIEDKEAHESVLYLNGNGVKGGPCGAAPLVALKKIVQDGSVKLGDEDVVVLFCTEGYREYVVPT